MNKERTTKSIVTINAAISLLAFIFIFINYNHVSGGNIAIVFFTMLFGLAHFLTIIIIGIFKNKYESTAIVTVAICQLIEQGTFSYWGFQIHNFLVSIGL